MNLFPDDISVYEGAEGKTIRLLRVVLGGSSKHPEYSLVVWFTDGSVLRTGIIPGSMAYDQAALSQESDDGDTPASGSEGEQA